MSKDLNSMQKGLVTMADILGWKGIWRESNKSHLDILISIKKEIKQNVFDYSARILYEQLEKSYPILEYTKRIITNDFDKIKEWAENNIEKEEEDKINILFKEYKNEALYDAFFERLQEKYTNIFNAQDIKKQVVDNLSKQLLTTNRNLDNEEALNHIEMYLNGIHKEDPSLVLNGMEEVFYILQDVSHLDNSIERIVLTAIMKEEKKNIDIIFDTYLVDPSVDLLSDTFIFCSHSENRALHLEIHSFLCKQIIEKCLENNLLIRGAMSYGEYRSEQSVFIGPAIDEAASWHEMAQEVSIFLTPSVSINFQNELKNNKYFVLREVPFKSRRFITYCVKWEDHGGQFAKIAKEESPMLPEFADKYTNTLKYLEKNKRQVVASNEKKNRPPAVISLTNY